MVKIAAIFISSISLVSGIIMPFILSVVKRNAKNTDDKLSILYTGQNNTIKAINDLELKYNDTKNKTGSNYTALQEHKAEVKTRFEAIDDRQKDYSERSIKNKIDIAILQIKCQEIN